jgi:hypothetical protein
LRGRSPKTLVEAAIPGLRRQRRQHGFVKKSKTGLPSSAWQPLLYFYPAFHFTQQLWQFHTSLRSSHLPHANKGLQVDQNLKEHQNPNSNKK